MDHKQLWDKCLIEIESNLSKQNFITWFKNTHISKEDSGTIFVGVPNEFVKDWLFNKYHKLISKTITINMPAVRSVEYIVAKYESGQTQIKEVEIKISTPTNTLPLQDLYINKEDNLNPRYIFETFIVGNFNELAYAAAQAIIKNPGRSYNPFFVYGPTGLGKTHLIQAIGNSIKQKFPEKKVHYIMLEKFASDLVATFQSYQANKSTVFNAFKEKYRKYDVLIIDDIQFIGKMEKTQEELFHLFNIMHESSRQIIFSSDKHPNYIPGLEDRLKSRFSQGMIVDIIEPDYESRLAILTTKAKNLNISLSDEFKSALEYIASVVQGNIRELEGSLNAVICQIQLKNRDISLNEVKNIIKNHIKPKKQVSIDEVVRLITDFYNLKESSLYEKTRRKEIVRARQVVMYILRENFNVSYPLIGQKLGGKDHTTVIHSYEKVKRDLKTDPLLGQEIDQIKLLFS
jgi:chromosomal replication initiator protein